jgi:hypothetical protein
MAQLCPSTFPSYDIDGDAAHVDLGHPGTYVSFGWEDLEAILPWIKLKGDEGHQTDEMGVVTGVRGSTGRREGLGFGA